MESIELQGNIQGIIVTRESMEQQLHDVMGVLLNATVTADALIRLERVVDDLMCVITCIRGLFPWFVSFFMFS